VIAKSIHERQPSRGEPPHPESHLVGNKLFSKVVETINYIAQREARVALFYERQKSLVY
jgi:hypothetical protein